TPDVPINLHVNNFSWNAVLLSWISGFDGGFQQQIIIEARSVAPPRAIDWSMFMEDSTDLKTFTVKDVPRVQTSHQCWLEDIHFPSLKNAELLSRELRLSFEHSTSSNDFCVQAERSPASLTVSGWIIFYNDCPTASRTTPLYASTLQVTQCLVSDINRRLRART
ncbi:hypothetical protein AHF37_05316, partial [Paragonimus kellicotti]